MRSSGFAVLTVLILAVVLLIVGKHLRHHDKSPQIEATQPSRAAALLRQDNMPIPNASVAPAAVRVIDGDTIAIGDEHIRLFGIDAPERDQPCTLNGQAIACGYEAGQILSRLIGSAQPSCIARSTDRYGRTVAVCLVNGKDLGREMVASGWAVAFVRYSQDYVADEAAARSARRGMWQGGFERPETWRAEHRQPRGHREG
ncbi:hypothetical protein GCM10023232_08910 [Sphingosinicella ginsenosidimutans]|uniref:Thermonuclease family protein n=1 Tax=Allosphingosinicella ginsenosidimutans TaxID=1176539 RepID=A0A5C6TWT6_9SPHN|nr:thermonuclease family protein [Sphingosinicella ginsenosidimutans]TXC64699.1 thermonuclease family protein [Sphingosinicella ginsenosidimutans]